MKPQKILFNGVKWLGYILVFLIFFAPFYLILLTSLKKLSETVIYPPSFWVNLPQWQNFKIAVESIQFWHYLKNSVIITGAVIACQLATIIPAAYAFSRYKFKGSEPTFFLVLSTSMIPEQLMFLPVFVMLSKSGLLNSYLSMVLPFATSSFGIFLLRQRFRQIPNEIIEAAKLDDATELTIMYKIMLPIARPTIATLGLLTFINTWNSYFWPMSMTTTEAVRTLQIGVVSLRILDGAVNHNVLMAGNVLLLIPIAFIFIIFQKQIINAFTYTGQK